jgi:arylsulfatase A-like enzyme
MKHLFLILILVLCFNLFAQNKKLNVLVLYSDDQRFNTIRVLGNNQIQTPNLDKLVKNGVAFTRAHTMGGMHGALCVPSRAMLHTGRYLHHLWGSGDSIPPSHTMLPEYLKDKGYQTYAIGKWHNDKASFSRSYQGGAALFFGGMHFPNVGGQEQPQYVDFDPTGQYKTPNKKASKYSSEFYADKAIDFLNTQQNTAKPFYCYVAFTSPHDPRTPPSVFRKMYPPNKIKLLPNFMSQHPFDNGELTVRDEQLLSRPMTKAQAQEELAFYYGMISELDAQIGRIVHTLKKNGQYDNTLIVFAGDNGLAVGSHGLLGKQNLYDHSMRVPLILVSPSLSKNKKIETLCYISDIFPTVLDILQLPKPPSVESQSLLPFMKNEKMEGRKAVYYAYRGLQRGVRTADNWKLIHYKVKGVETLQLFDLNKDPYEIQNLANDKRYQQKLEDMKVLLLKERSFYGDNGMN